MGDKVAFVGIDPGFTGYIVLLDKVGTYKSHFKTPIIVDKRTIKRQRDKYNSKGKLVWKAGHVSTKTDTRLDEAAISAHLKQIKDEYGDVRVCVERQHAITGQGLASTAKNMFGFGFWVGVCRALGLTLYVPTAVEWQKVFSDPKAEDKKAASVAAVKTWDKDIDMKKTKRSKVDDHNLADAVLIARFSHYKLGAGAVPPNVEDSGDDDVE